jgi:hypothetical protein
MPHGLLAGTTVTHAGGEIASCGLIVGRTVHTRPSRRVPARAFGRVIEKTQKTRELDAGCGWRTDRRFRNLR